MENNETKETLQDEVSTAEESEATDAPVEDAAPVTMSIDELIAKANEEAAAAEEATDAE